jgi:hypothetical protein
VDLELSAVASMPLEIPKVRPEFGDGRLVSALARRDQGRLS